MFVIAQVVGVCAVALYMLSFQFKKRADIVTATCASNCLYVLQYIMLGAFSGALIDTLSTISSFFASKKTDGKFKNYAKWVAITMIALIITAGVILAMIQKSWVELLPVVGAAFQTSGLWFNDEQTIRKFALMGAPFWLVYNFLSMAYGATIGTVLNIASVLLALLRFRKTKNQ